MSREFLTELDAGILYLTLSLVYLGVLWGACMASDGAGYNGSWYQGGLWWIRELPPGVLGTGMATGGARGFCQRYGPG